MKKINLIEFCEIGKSHYRMTTNQFDISYCYIRKNACSSFKNFFRELTDETIRKDYSSSLALMDSVYRVNKASAADATSRIVVLRDPVERFFSAIKNKLIQQKGHTDLFLDFHKNTGRDLNSVSISDFLNLYILQHKLKTLDPHFHTQISHMHGIEYNCVIKIDQLFEHMKKIVPANLADRYFKSPSNSTALQGHNQYKWWINSQSSSVLELHNEYCRTKIMPSISEILSYDEILKIQELYKEDYWLLNQG